MTIFDYIYKLLTDYFLPATTDFPYWEYIIIAITAIISLAIFWCWIIRPFWWFFKYGMWGGSKTKSRKNKWGND